MIAVVYIVIGLGYAFLSIGALVPLDDPDATSRVRALFCGASATTAVLLIAAGLGR